MSEFTTPTLPALIAGAQANINGRVPGADSRLRRSVLGVLGTVWAGAEYALFGYQDYISDQVLPDTADLAHLTRYASIYGLQPGGATPAAGPASCTGGAAKTDVPSGTLLQTANSVEYLTTADLVLDANGDGEVAIQAVVPGSAGLQVAGVALTLVSPIAGVPNAWVVAGEGLTDGADPETQPELLADVEDRIQEPPAAGDQDDYVKWAKASGIGVTRAWCYPGWMGLGTVGVTFMLDNRANPQPTAADVAAVQAYIDGVRGVTAEVIVFAPIVDVVPLTIQLSPNTATTQAAVTAELTALFVREAAPGSGVLRSHVDGAIEVAAGVNDHALIQPGAGNIVSGAGHLATLGALTWQG